VKYKIYKKHASSKDVGTMFDDLYPKAEPKIVTKVKSEPSIKVKHCSDGIRARKFSSSIPATISLKEGDIYIVSGMWGDAHCEYLGEVKGHHLFQSLKGKWKISFSHREIYYGLCRNWLHVFNEKGY